MDTYRDGKPRKGKAALAFIGGTITFVSTVAYLGVCVWIAKGCPPMMPLLWHSVMNFCQSAALTFGVYGMMAEQEYVRAMEASKL